MSARDLFELANVEVPEPKLPTIKRHMKSADEIVRIIGIEKATALCSQLGGIDRRLNEIKALVVKAVGDEAAELLIDHFGCERIYIPRVIASHEARAAEVIARRKAGETITQIALAVNLGERRVYAILKERRS